MKQNQTINEYVSSLLNEYDKIKHLSIDLGEPIKKDISKATTIELRVCNPKDIMFISIENLKQTSQEIASMIINALLRECKTIRENENFSNVLKSDYYYVIIRDVAQKVDRILTETRLNNVYSLDRARERELKELMPDNSKDYFDGYCKGYVDCSMSMIKNKINDFTDNEKYMYAVDKLAKKYNIDKEKVYELFNINKEATDKDKKEFMHKTRLENTSRFKNLEI